MTASEQPPAARSVDTGPQDRTASVVTSMTGFARREGGTDALTWTWEARSVNGKGLDVRVRYPQGLDVMDGVVRAAVGARFRRGSISVTLSVSRPSADRTNLAVGGGAVGYVINHALLEELVEIARRLQPDAPPSVTSLFSVRGVVEQVEESTEHLFSDYRTLIEADLLSVLDDLSRARAEEGRRLATGLADQINNLSDLAAEASALAEMQPGQIERKLSRALDDLLQPGDAASTTRNAVAPDRLAQEVAILAAKADIREELDRLAAHLDQGRDLLASDDAVGRRLDFLCQELNREANTLCSKSSSVDLTRIGMAMKVTIEQFREQVQNVE